MEQKEQLLQAWIKMSVGIRGNRLLKQLSTNEMIICSSLAQKQQLTASEVCTKTHMLKSQANRIINDLLNKNIIEKKRDDNDRRKIYLSLTSNGLQLYNREHLHVINIVTRITDQLGAEKSALLAQYMSEAVNILEGETND